MAVATESARLDFELSTGCDHRCAHCYNIWNAEEGDPQHGYRRRGPPSTSALKETMSRAVEQSGAVHLTLTGGEPLLRKDALDIIDHARQLVPSVSLISNGSHIDEATARALRGVRSVQLTLLAGDRDLHDRLKGAVCFDDTTRAAIALRDAGVPSQCCFVALSDNRGELRSVLELCVALDMGSLSYNRMSPAGGAIHHSQRLMPDPRQLEEDLEVADRLGRAWNIAVGTAMPIPPCLVRIERYSWIRFGFCSVGSSSPSLVVDPWGDVRSCNLSGHVLGNVLEDDWSEIVANPYLAEFRMALPKVCSGCAYEKSCQGGCKESGFASFGALSELEPLVRMVLE